MQAKGAAAAHAEEVHLAGNERGDARAVERLGRTVETQAVGLGEVEDGARGAQGIRELLDHLREELVDVRVVEGVQDDAEGAGEPSVGLDQLLDEAVAAEGGVDGEPAKARGAPGGRPLDGSNAQVLLHELPSIRKRAPVGPAAVLLVSEAGLEPARPFS